MRVRVLTRVVEDRSWPIRVNFEHIVWYQRPPRDKYTTIYMVTGPELLVTELPTDLDALTVNK